MGNLEFVRDVGEIVSRNNECFWIFPSAYIYDEKIRICSPWFHRFDEKWHLVLHSIKDSNNSNSRHLYLHLWRKCRNQLNREYTVEFILKNVKGEILKKFQGDINYDFGFYLRISSISYTLLQAISSCGLMRLFFAIHIKENTEAIPLAPEVEMKKDQKKNKDGESTDDESVSDEEHDNVTVKSKGLDRLARNLKRILYEEQNYDAILKVEDREFKVHRTILTAQSPVFASMFQHDTEENKTGVVNIPDCSAEAFNVFLSYVYTGSATTISSDNVFNLYYCADKYQIDELKSECIDFMKRNLSVENFCEVMSLSLQHGEKGLRKKAMSFFCSNVKSIIKTVQWQKYMRDYPTQANELYIKAIDY